MNDSKLRETPKAAAAFHEYCLLGYDRSLVKLAHKLGKTSAYTRCLEAWSSQYNWQKRVSEHDLEQQEIRRIEEEKQRKEDQKAIREMLLKHIGAEVDKSSTSQIQAAKLLLEYYTTSSEISQIKEELHVLQETLKSLGAEL